MVILTVVVSVFSVELDVINDSDDERLHGDVSGCQDLSPGVSFVNDEHSVTLSSPDSVDRYTRSTCGGVTRRDRLDEE
jgi:hypothetical protein